MKKEASLSPPSSRAHRRAPFRLSRRTGIQLACLLLSLPALTIAGRWLLEDETSEPLPDVGLRPSLEAIGAQSIIVRENGRKLWEFSADRITISPDKRFATATNMKRGVLFRNGKPFLTVSAQTVRLNQETHNWQASGKLQASGPDGLSIVTSRATWSHRRERLSCPDVVSAKLRGMDIQTRGVFYEAQTRQLKCPATVEVRSAQATIREGRDVVADARSRRIEFRSGVHITIKRSALDAYLANPTGAGSSAPPAP